MTEIETKVITKIRESKDPVKAMEIAISLIWGLLQKDG